MRFLPLIVLFALSGCATVNYSYRGKPCENVLETEESVVLKCTKLERGAIVRERP